uniref:Phosphate transporter n=1 Tax=Pteris vittata TaxID=13821 RepID=A0AA95Z1V2_PTEVI|nr:phosphate transporter B 4;1 [Pteris vittata]
MQFGASVGSGVLTLRQSVLLAFVMEVLGATFLGSHSIDVVDSFILKERPSNDLLMWGCFIAMIAAALWLALATYLEMPVTSFLSIQGAIIGVGLTVEGWNSIYWSKHDSDSVLHVGGLTGILLSWVVVPLMSLVGAFTFFMLIKVMLLRSLVVEKRAQWLWPPLYGITVSVLVVFIIYMGAPGTSIRLTSLWKVAVISSSSAIFTILLASIILVCLARKQSELLDGSPTTQPDIAIPGQQGNNVADRREDSPEDLLKQFNELRVLHTVYEVDEEAADDSPRSTIRCSPVCGPAIQLKHMLSGTPNQLPFQKLAKPKRIAIKQRIVDCVHKIRGYTFDHKIEYGRETAALHALAEKFHKRVEEPFGFLLILTASISTLVHGSNTVPSVMALYAGILNIFRSHSTQNTEDLLTWPLDTWVRLLGGFAVSMGYGIWGWKVVRCLGGRLMFLSPSRAFSAQFCTLATVILATRVKFPFSTAHVFIGALVGVSLADNIKSLDWRLLGVFILMWALTLLFTCGTASAFYAFTVFSPSVLVRD